MEVLYIDNSKRANISKFGIRITVFNFIFGLLSIILAYYFSNKYPKIILSTGSNGESIIETVENPVILWGILGGAFIIIVLFSIGAEIIELLHRIEISNRLILVSLKESSSREIKNN